MKAKVTESYLFKCFVVVFLCFVFDSVISYFLPYNFAKKFITIVPCTGLMMFSLLVKTIEGPERYFFASICGVYYSVIYSNSLAIYILIYCLIAFIRSYIVKLEKFNLLESIVFCISTVFSQEIMVYWLMWITKTTQYPITSFLMMRIAPTLLANLILFIGVYVIYNKVKIEVE